MTLRFAYSTINWGTKCDLPAALDEIRAAGWHAVELFDHSLDWLGAPDNLRNMLGGLKVPAFFGGIEVPVSRDTITLHKNRLDYAALFGTEQYGLVGGGRLRQRPPTDAEYTSLADACEEMAQHAANLGIEIAYHPHTGCTIETEAEIDILLTKSPTTKLCLDVSHIRLVDEDPTTQLRKYAARTGYIHMKDWARGKFVELGEGNIGIDFPAILADLEARHFDGWVVIENSRSDISPAHSAQFNADYLRGLGYTLDVTEKVNA